MGHEIIPDSFTMDHISLEEDGKLTLIMWNEHCEFKPTHIGGINLMLTSI